MKSNKVKKIITLRGIISIISTGGGFVSSPELKNDVFIPFQFLNTALHGDEVEITLSPQINDERPKGEVINIVKRNKKRFVGVIERKKDKNFSFLTADDSKMYVDIFIPKTPFNAKNNTKALVEITEWNDPKKNPEGKIIKVIGMKGDNDAEMESIVIEKGFEINFPKEVEQEAREIKKLHQLKIKTNIKERKDMTNVLTFTIDPIDAKDFDDAISYKKISDDLYEIGVHIADVSYWVQEKTFIDKEARKRGFSIYLPDRTIPMLPEVLSNDICSLNPGESKMTFSGIFKINTKGEVKDSWFGKTVIKSDKRFTYEEAQKILDSGEGVFAKELSKIMEITRKMRELRINNGAMDIPQDEVKIEVDNNGVVKNIYVKEGIETQNLIEELMLLANREVAVLMSDKKNGRVCVYRIHDKPDRDALRELIIFLKKLGHQINLRETNITSKDLNELLKSFQETEEDFMVKSIVVRSMPKAIYSVDDKGHFALALKHYAHFTSPIRRYADLLVHRSLVKKIEGKKSSKEEQVFYKETADLLSQREIDLAQAERESIAFKQIEFMINKTGEIRRGIISGLTNWGIYVSDIETRTEGMISLKEMKDDFYFLDKENFAIIGSRTKKKYFLGTKVKFKVIGGNVDQKKLEYAFLK